MVFLTLPIPVLYDGWLAGGGARFVPKQKCNLFRIYNHDYIISHVYPLYGHIVKRNRTQTHTFVFVTISLSCTFCMAARPTEAREY